MVSDLDGLWRVYSCSPLYNYDSANINDYSQKLQQQFKSEFNQFNEKKIKVVSCEPLGIDDSGIVLLPLFILIRFSAWIWL